MQEPVASGMVTQSLAKDTPASFYDMHHNHEHTAGANHRHAPKATIYSSAYLEGERG